MVHSEGFKSGDGIRFFSRIRIVFLVMVLSFASAAPAFSVDDEQTLWNALKSGNHFALLRHAIAPGTGDPEHFTLGECGTQRNLSQEGRRQAVKIGARFREGGIPRARVFSSQWCRCLETAKLLGLGPVMELPALNSFYQRHGRRELQTRMLAEWLMGQDLEQPLVLVTHQVNITALTGIYPGSGELVIVHRSPAGALTVVGTLE